MNRRKGVPCGCGADPCGCSPKNHCVKAINNVSPDPNGDFAIEAGQNVTITETEYGIEIAATGGSSEDAVKSVNGELPDADGDVTIDTGVMTVNGVSADADGEVTITAGSNITITPDAETNSIEIEASVPTVDAVAPIYIDGDGKIALKNWSLYTGGTDWRVFREIVDGYSTITEDLLIILQWEGQREQDIFYLPKGFKYGTYMFLNAPYWHSTPYDDVYYFGSLDLPSLLGAGNTATFYVYSNSASGSNVSISGKSYSTRTYFARSNKTMTKVITQYPNPVNTPSVYLMRRI